MKKLRTFASIYFRKKSHFEEHDTRSYLVFQPMCKYFKKVASLSTGNYIYFWKYKKLSNENITAPPTVASIPNQVILVIKQE